MKLCECGCGEPTPIAKRTSTRDRTVKGQPLRFIPNHHQKAIPRHRIPPAERFWAKVTKADSGECWGWTARITSDGYGQFREGGKGSRNVRAHRFAYELTKGPIPEGLLVCHTCDNPLCCNPAHLFVGTVADNAADMVAKGRSCRGAAHRNYGKAWAKATPEQRARGERNGTSKLTANMVREIRRFYQQGMRQVDLASRFGVEQSNISNIIRRKTWKHVA
jgi:predicted XRE-type DNA-binding protein